MADGLRGWSGHGWPQHKTEVEAFIKLLVDEGVRSYLEIGCRHGDTFHAVGEALPQGSLLVGVDLPGARSGKRVGGRNPNSHFWLHKAKDDLKKRGQDAVVFIGDSHDKKTIKQVSEIASASGGMFDAVFIDGDHSADGVRSDWENYGVQGRIVAFHDICSKPPGPFYKGLTKTMRHTELKFNGVNGGFGIVWNV